MWGVFTRRKSLDVWNFRTDEEEVDVIYFNHPLPILDFCRYKIETTSYGTTIVDGVRGDWCREVHSAFFPDTPFTDNFDPKVIERQHFKSLDCIRWLKFDMEFKIQRLVPNRNAKEYLHYVRKNKLTELVRKFGGVDPLALRRFTTNEELIEEAVALEMITERMKEVNKVWLTEDDCPMLLIEDTITQDACVRLSKANVLVHKDNAFAMKWAADQATKYPLDDVIGNHQDGIHPAPISSLDRTKVIAADRFMAVDSWIDRKIVVSTMMDGVEWQATHHNEPNIPTFKILFKAKQYVRDQLTKHFATTSVTFSFNGAMDFDSTGSRTSLFQPPDGGSPVVAEIKRNLRDPSSSLVSSKIVPNNVVFSNAQPLSRAKFDACTRILEFKPPVVVLWFRKRAEFRWIPHFKEYKGLVIMAYVGV